MNRRPMSIAKSGIVIGWWAESGKNPGQHCTGAFSCRTGTCIRQCRGPLQCPWVWILFLRIQSIRHPSRTGKWVASSKYNLEVVKNGKDPEIRIVWIKWRLSLKREVVMGIQPRSAAVINSFPEQRAYAFGGRIASNAKQKESSI
jgi:hypothetical protein